MKTNALLSACVLSLFSLVVRADWESHLLPRSFDHADSLPKASALAREKNKAVILYYTRTNCPPCNWLQGQLRQDSVGQPYRDNYVFTAVWGNGMSSKEREQYRSRYDVQGAPTWLFFNAAGEYVCTSRGGFASPEDAKNLHEAAQQLLAAATGSVPDRPRNCR